MSGEGEEAVGAAVESWRHMWGAKVQWPAEMPDDMLQTIIGAVLEPRCAAVIACVRLARIGFAVCALRCCCLAPLAESAHEKLDPITDWQSQGDDVVQALKQQFDAAWSPSWHVIIGKNFGSRVTHEARRMVFFYLGDKAVLVFKA